jgi:hypothetical protein
MVFASIQGLASWMQDDELGESNNIESRSRVRVQDPRGPQKQPKT